MPYVKERNRELYKPLQQMLDTFNLLHPGDLNYLLTLVCQRYLQTWGDETRDVTYREYNDIIGALEACKLELYRRMVAPYEDEAIKRNGDVY